MVHKVEIKDNQKSPIRYLADLDNFQNGKKYIFKPGVNIIVGENGSGKTTLMNIIKKYLLVDYIECGRGSYNFNINSLYKKNLTEKEFFDGIDVYADYEKNTFRLSHAGEMEKHQDINSLNDFGTMIEQKSASTGESVVIAINSLFRQMFSKKANLYYNYAQFDKNNRPEYAEYINKHRMKGDEWTILMDEPDRNLDIKNIEQIKSILSFHKEHTQMIAVVHNPLLIYSLSNNKDIHFIELTKDYIIKMRDEVDSLLHS